MSRLPKRLSHDYEELKRLCHSGAALEPEAGNHPDIATVLVVSPSHTVDRFPRLVAVYNLTPREREMVELVAAGLSTKEIAGRLFVTPYTVQDHLKKILEKMGVTSRRELMALVFRHGSPVGQ